MLSNMKKYESNLKYNEHTDLLISSYNEHTDLLKTTVYVVCNKVEL